MISRAETHSLGSDTATLQIRLPSGSQSVEGAGLQAVLQHQPGGQFSAIWVRYGQLASLDSLHVDP